MMQFTKDIISRALACARNDCALSQNDIAKKIGKSKLTIQNWESGYTVPSVIDFFNFFDVLDINPVPYFMNMNEKDTRKKIDNYLMNYAGDDIVDKLGMCLYNKNKYFFFEQLEMLYKFNNLSDVAQRSICEHIHNVYDIENPKLRNNT